MLTVLIRGWSGHERILQTKEVRSEPPSEFRNGGYCYYIDREDGTCERIDGEHSSSLYVMNDQGSTVAKYHFTRDPKVAAGPGQSGDVGAFQQYILDGDNKMVKVG